MSLPLIVASTFGTVGFSELLHNFNMTKHMKGEEIKRAQTLGASPFQYTGHTFDVDLDANTVRMQRLSGVGAMTWGDTSGIL